LNDDSRGRGAEQTCFETYIASIESSRARKKHIPDSERLFGNRTYTAGLIISNLVPEGGERKADVFSLQGILL
jgi:hypothetical protein